jgi:diguanylate cyclase (GGDEF) domain
MKYFSKDQILPTCAFRDHDLEISYRIQSFAGYKRYVLPGATAVMALFILFLVPDCIFVNDSAAFLRIAAIRLSIVPVFFVFYFLFGRLKSSRAYLRTVNAMELAFTVLYLLVLSNYSALDLGMRCLELAIVVIIFFTFPNLWLSATINAFVLILSFTVFCICAASRLGLEGFFAQGIAYLAVAFLFCAANFYRINYFKRSQYYNINIMKKRINTDKLTGAFTRAKFDEDIKKQIATADQTGKHFSIAIFDIDNFKRINDTYGHMEGDKVLTGIAEVVNLNKRPRDILSRWGGEEFVILFPSTTISAAVRVTDRLRVVISTTIFSVGERITCSFGVTEYQDGDTPATLLRRADKLMYDAKAAGKNYVVSSM